MEVVPLTAEAAEGGGFGLAWLPVGGWVPVPYCHGGSSSQPVSPGRLHEHDDVPWTRSHLPAIDLISSSATTSVNDTAVALASLYIYSFLLTKGFATQDC